ncbi:MAG: LysM domain-containing protein [Acidobacteriota bacterium]
MNEALRQLDALLSNAAAVPARFPPNSRYNGLPTLTHVFPDGRTVAYVTRRFIPGPEYYLLAREHLVVQGDRLDLLAARYLADPEQWWKIADANVALVPEELTDEVGARVRIAVPGTTPGGGGV